MVREKHKKIKDMKIHDRPREKMERFGPEPLNNDELMQILLGSGMKGKDVKVLAKEIWNLFYRKHYKVKREDLEKIKGLGNAKISQILACLELAVRMKGGREVIDTVDSKRIWEKLADMREYKKEHFIVLFLNSRKKEMGREVISIGTVNASIVHPREVFRQAIQHSAASVLGVHNHPSDDVNPSDADLNVTRRLVEAGDLLGVEFVDHIIVSRTDHYSIREHHPDLFD